MIGLHPLTLDMKRMEKSSVNNFFQQTIQQMFL